MQAVAARLSARQAAQDLLERRSRRRRAPTLAQPDAASAASTDGAAPSAAASAGVLGPRSLQRKWQLQHRRAQRSQAGGDAQQQQVDKLLGGMLAEVFR
jgi:hypothetical protein